MTPDDPRHGKLRGHSAGCRDACCRRAYARYEKRRRLNAARGLSLAIPAIGAQRRIQALMTLGWTTTDIAHAAGWTHRNRVSQILSGQKGKPCRWLTRSTDVTIARIYAEWCMTLPEQTGPRRRSRARAIQLGYLPPLVWENIDDPTERPRGAALNGEPDRVVVERLLAGERLESTKAEKEEAMRRWLADGRSQRALCAIHGWHEGRYAPKKDAA